MSRTKGHSFERWVAREFRPVFPHAQRGLQYRDGADAADVKGVGPFWLECKRMKRTNPKRALKQASLDAAGTGKFPLAVCKDDYAEPTVTMQLDDFLELLQTWERS